MESVLQYPAGSLVFQARDPDRTPRTVVRTRLDASSRHRQVVLGGRDGTDDCATPSSLVYVDETLRPTGPQIEDCRAHLARAIYEESARCSLCRRAHTFWSTFERCIIGKRLLEELGSLYSYRDNVLPWLTGQPVDPARLQWGQRVVIRTADGERAGVVSPIDHDGVWHEAGTDGLILVRHRDGTPPTRYAAHLVFHDP